MKKCIVLLLIVSFILSSSFRLGAEIQNFEGKSSAEIPYQNALDYLAELDFELAYKWLEIVIQDFPKSEKAKEAAVLKALISSSWVGSYHLLCRKYFEGFQKAIRNEEKSELLNLWKKICEETERKACKKGELLCKDVESLFQYIGEPIYLKIKIKKQPLQLLRDTYIPRKLLERGFVPTLGEQEKIENFQQLIDFSSNLLAFLYGSSPERVEKEEKLQPRRIFEGKIDWAGCIMCVGDWLAHHLGLCKSRFLDLEEAKKVAMLAKKCFEKVGELLKDQPYSKVRVRAEERIDEIDEQLAKLMKRKGE